MLAYPIATVLAEKTEIILDLGIRNSRMKNFYDMHLILTDEKRPSTKECLEALENTWKFRNNKSIDFEIFEDWYFVLDEIKENRTIFNEYWPNYSKDRQYTFGLNFIDIVLEIESYIKELQIQFTSRSGT